MNRALFKICVFGGKRRGECLATFIVRRSHLATVAFAAAIAGVYSVSSQAQAGTAVGFSPARMLAGAAERVAAFAISKGATTVGAGVENVRHYEQELKLRADSLETVLRDLKSLEGVDRLERQSSDAAAARSQSSKSKLGIGGGIDRRSPVIANDGRQSGDRSITLSRQSESASKKPSSSVVEELDNLMDRIRQLPIGSPTDGDVSSDFGYRRSPVTGARGQLHTGIDISTEIRSAVTATADGRVVSTGYKSNYGQTVIIDHGDGFETLYGHLSKITVRPGDHVCRGEEIGLVGMTGRSTGPHLHYEIRLDGIARNPRNFIELADILKLI